ncbi:hypothetical protein FGB62_235g020 [Gracilaria domingensis]|nr:hypothetical protein FGB62_235g020 [Gracilaria domingensis]
MGTYLCAISDGSMIAIGITAAVNILRCIPLFVSGEAVMALHEPARKLRFLSYAADKDVLVPEGTSMIEWMVPKWTLENLAMVAVAVASEEGVVGLAENRSTRQVDLGTTRQVTTMSAFGGALENSEIGEWRRVHTLAAVLTGAGGDIKTVGEGTCCRGFDDVGGWELVAAACAARYEDERLIESVYLW